MEAIIAILVLELVLGLGIIFSKDNKDHKIDLDYEDDCL